MAETEKPSGMVRDFSKVIITLDNVLVPEEKLSPTPSMLDGLDLETETDLRILGCELIQTSGILLKLPQVAMATGQVLFQRFYFSKSFVKHNMEVLAMACINLASKIEESPRRIRDVINVFHHVRQVKNGKNITPLVLDQSYVNLKSQVIKAERRILKELGFCVHVKHPHKIIVTYLQVLEAQSNQELVQMAWNYMNDSFRTDVFVRHMPETIACACIYLAARNLQIPLPNSPPWFAVFRVEEHEIVDICRAILRLYTRAKPNVDELERTVNEVKKTHIEAKLKAKGISSANVTPNSSSRPASPAKVSPSPLTVPGLKKIKSEDDKSDHSSVGEHNTSNKKRGHSHSSSRSRTRSRSRSKERSYSSRSHSRSPAPKRRYTTPPKKSKKESRRREKYSYRDRDYKENRDKYYKDSYNDTYKDDYNYKDAYSSYREKDYKDSHRDKDYKDYKYGSKRHRSPSYTPERDGGYGRSPDRGRHRKPHKEKSRKHNGHRRSRSRDRYRR